MAEYKSNYVNGAGTLTYVFCKRCRGKNKKCFVSEEGVFTKNNNTNTHFNGLMKLAVEEESELGKAQNGRRDREDEDGDKNGEIWSSGSGAMVW